MERTKSFVYMSFTGLHAVENKTVVFEFVNMHDFIRLVAFKRVQTKFVFLIS
jgi:hypothetical protein